MNSRTVTGRKSKERNITQEIVLEISCHVILFVHLPPNWDINPQSYPSTEPFLVFWPVLHPVRDPSLSLLSTLPGVFWPVPLSFSQSGVHIMATLGIFSLGIFQSQRTYFYCLFSYTVHHQRSCKAYFTDFCKQLLWKTLTQNYNLDIHCISKYRIIIWMTAV